MRRLEFSGVVWETLIQRTREIGLRMALGAQAGYVLRIVVGRGLALTIAGIMVGAGAGVPGPVSSVGLFGIEPRDAVALGAIVAG